MAEYLEEQRIRTGRPFYVNSGDSSSNNSQSSFDYFQGRVQRYTSITTERTQPERPFLKRPRPARTRTGKLANTRDNALRFLRSVISATPKSESIQRLPERRKSHQEQERVAREEDMRSGELLRAGRSSSNAGAHTRPSISEVTRVESNHSVSSNSRGRNGSMAMPEERPVAAGNGVSVSLNLAEPVLFLQGFEQGDSSNRNTTMLRGHLHLKIVKNVKIKTITLKFKGTATTKWPEGIPPKKTEFEEVDTLMGHTWPFFNAQFATAEGGSCADHVRLATGQIAGASPYESGSPSSSSVNLHSRDKRLSLSAAPSRSFDKDSAKHPPTVAQKGYRTFYPGDYLYNFELPLDSRLPETIDVELGSVKYELEAIVERAGAFKTNLQGIKEVMVVRAPSENSLEQVEPIAISRNWEDQLHYDIVISGKSFPLGAKIPVAFKLTPLAKVQCHRIKVFITENIEYFCSNKRVHRMEPTRKVLLFEKRSDGTTTSTFPGSSARTTAGGGVPFDQREAAARGEDVTTQDPNNLLGHLDQDANVGPTEMEFNVQLPGCHNMTERDRMNRLHFDTTYQNIQVHHWIKIVMRLSKPDKDDPNKRRHFEISIDSPFHILSCRASLANTALPAYSSPDLVDPTTNLAVCGCPGAPKRRISPQYVPTLNSLNNNNNNGSHDDDDAATSRDAPSMRPSLARPPTAHLNNPNGALQRPIHMLRAPSFNPPAFDAEEPPPPLVTPPPMYGDIASPTIGHGLADYFSRLADTYEDETDSDEEVGHVRGRVNVPLTPGARVNRSMDIGRSWTPVGR